jgi:hypothetical protein
VTDCFYQGLGKSSFCLVIWRVYGSTDLHDVLDTALIDAGLVQEWFDDD